MTSEWCLTTDDGRRYRCISPAPVPMETAEHVASETLRQDRKADAARERRRQYCIACAAAERKNREALRD